MSWPSILSTAMRENWQYFEDQDKLDQEKIDEEYERKCDDEVAFIIGEEL